jgi:hypothetical protein
VDRLGAAALGNTDWLERGGSSQSTNKRIFNMTIDDILDDRGKRYGNYLEQATITQRIRLAMSEGLGDRQLAYDQADAIHMIAVKLSRIINGDPNYPDNWRDIAGYAQLVADRLEGKSR